MNKYLVKNTKLNKFIRDMSGDVHLYGEKFLVLPFERATFFTSHNDAETAIKDVCTTNKYDIKDFKIIEI